MSKGAHIQDMSWAATRQIHLSNPCPHHQILKIRREALEGFSHTFSPEDLNNTSLSQDRVFEMALPTGRVGGRHPPRMG